jgi:hypothetical protein
MIQNKTSPKRKVEKYIKEHISPRMEEIKNLIPSIRKEFMPFVLQSNKNEKTIQNIPLCSMLKVDKYA